MDIYALREALVGSPRAGETDKDAHRRTSRALTHSGMDFGLNPQAASGAADLLGLLNEAAVSEGMTKFGPAGFDHDDVAANREGQRAALLERDDDPSLLRDILGTLPPQQLANILGELFGETPPAPRERDVRVNLPLPPRGPNDDLPPPPEMAGFLRSKR